MALGSRTLIWGAFTFTKIVPTGQRQTEEALKADEEANDFKQVQLLLLVSQRPQQSQTMKLSSHKNELLRILPDQTGDFLCITFLCVSPAPLMADRTSGMVHDLLES